MTKQYQNRNLWLIIIATTFYNFFSVIADPNLTNFVLSEATSSKFLIGFYNFLMNLGIILLQFNVSKKLQNKSLKNYPTFYKTLIFDFLFTLSLALSVFFLFKSAYFLLLFFLFQFLLQLNRGITQPALTDLIHENFDKEQVLKLNRTKLIFVSFFKFIALMISYFILNKYFSLDKDYFIYYLIFAIAPLGYLISMRFFKPNEYYQKPANIKNQNSLKLALQTVSTDKKYKKFLISTIFSYFSYTFVTFIVVFAKERINLSFDTLFLISAVVLLSNALLGFAIGNLAYEKFYEKYLTVFRLLGIIFLLMLLILPTSLPLIFIVLILQSCVIKGETLVFDNIKILFGKANSAMYSSSYFFIKHIVQMVGLLTTGLLIDLLGYNFSIVFACVLLAISIFLLNKKTSITD